MASFDFIEASAKGFEFCWERASYILHVALPVIFIKVFCLLTAFTMKIPVESLAYGLIVFPSYAIEAVFVIGLVRYYAFNEPIYVWGKIVTPPDIKNHKEKPLFFHAPHHRKIPIKAGIATYCLIRLITLFITGILLQMKVSSTATDAPEQTPVLSTPDFVLGLALFIGSLYATIWAIRLIFIFIPVTLDASAKDYLRKIKGMKVSIMMMFTIMICGAPLFIINAGGLNILDLLFGFNSAPYVVGSAIISATCQIIETSILSIAITYGICNMMFTKNNNTH